MKKDYSLLRPFDLEAAKRGESICWKGEPYGVLEYVGEPVVRHATNFGWPSPGNTIGVFKWREGTPGVSGKAGFYTFADLRMTPLCWIEGKPVYKGDVLYLPDGGKCIAHKDTIEWPKGNHQPWPYVETDVLTWTPPKVKREGWITVRIAEKGRPFLAHTSHVYASKEEAEKYTSGRAFIHIEWEELA